MDLKSEKGNIVSTARWVGYGLVDALANDFFDMSKLKDDAGFISEHGRLMLHLIQLRFTAEPNHPHKTQLLQNIDPKFGLLGFTLEILRVEADLASNHKHHIAMFVGQIMEELAEVGVGHKSLTPIKRTVDDFVEFATRPLAKEPEQHGIVGPPNRSLKTGKFLKKEEKVIKKDEGSLSFLIPFLFMLGLLIAGAYFFNKNYNLREEEGVF